MTANPKTESLNALLKAVRDDGVLDERELKILKDEMLKDHAVSAEEATLLFDLAAEVAEDQAKDDFEKMYVDGITSYLLNGPKGQGALDTERWIWLQDRIADDHMYTELEEKLLRNIVENAQSLPENFHDWLHHLEVHLKDFGGDLDELEYEQRTSFLAELKAFIKRLTR